MVSSSRHTRFPRRGTARGPTIALTTSLLLGLAAPAAWGQAPTPTTTMAGATGFLPGQLVERVASAANPGEQYAVYVPSNYRPEVRWPVLLLMDPRGRALIPLTRIRDVAERLGYLVMSSYNTRSDAGTDPNADALNAMLADAQRFFSLDAHRLYLVGQSGTARASWIYGFGLRGHVAGLIGIGASQPQSFLLTPRPVGTIPPLVYFGAAGTTDFNFDEMWALDTVLDRANLPHRVSYFDGPHAWPPAATLTEAVEWMELMAMRFGLKPQNPAWIDSTLAEALGQASAMAQAGDAYHAWRRYRAITSDFEGLRDTREASARAAALARTDPVRRTERRIAETVRVQTAYNQRLATLLGSYRRSGPPPLEEALDQLQLRELEQRAAGTDTLDANAAERGLEQLWVYSSFYEPMDYFHRGAPERALAMLDVAQAMRPNHPEVCYNRARALVRLGHEHEAIEALECAARSMASADRLEQDPDLASLAREPAFRALLTRLRTRPAGRGGGAGL
jgi:tetratricopeptide (TPR) repeat protein